MERLQKLFRKTLVDKYIEFASRESEPATFFNKLGEEIRQELSKGNIDEKIITYEKIFLVLFYPSIYILSFFLNRWM